MTANAVMKASTTTRDSETGRRTQDTSGTKAATPPNSCGIGRSHDISARYLSHAFGVARVLRAGIVACMAMAGDYGEWRPNHATLCRRLHAWLTWRKMPSSPMW
jgi:hypothetical protein